MYGLGAVLALFRMLWGLLRIARMIVRGIAERLSDGCVLVQTTETKVPFSFFQSPLRQRLIMLTRNASPALRAWKYGLFLYSVFACLSKNRHIAAGKNAGIPRRLRSTFKVHDDQHQIPGSSPKGKSRRHHHCEIHRRINSLFKLSYSSQSRQKPMRGYHWPSW